MKSTTEALDAITLNTWNTDPGERIAQLLPRLENRMATLAMAEVSVTDDEDFEDLAA